MAEQLSLFDQPSVLDMVREFHETFGATIDERSNKVLAARWSLISEEFEEVGEAFVDWDSQRDNLTHIAKELSDLVYVVYGAAVNLGIDLDEAVRRVHQSNMSKVWDDGKPRYEGIHGKVVKGPNYQAPDLTDTVKDLS